MYLHQRKSRRLNFTGSLGNFHIIPQPTKTTRKFIAHHKSHLRSFCSLFTYNRFCCSRRIRRDGGCDYHYLLNKFDNFFSKEVKLRGSIEENIVELKNEHDMITEVLRSSDALIDQGGQTPLWIQQLRIIDFDIQSVLNTHAYKNAIPWHSRLMSTRSRTIAGNISSIEKGLKRIKGNREAYQITLPSHPASTSSEHEGMAPLYTPEVEIVGIEGAREELASWVLDVAQAYRAKFIVGKAGSGKTALVRLVYKQLKMDFDCHVWLSASKFERKEELLSAMYNKLCKGTTVSSSTPAQDIVEALREYLKNKRYLIVLDDWSRKDWWDFVKYALPSDNNDGISRVILTTRRGDIVSSCRDSSVDISRIEPLPFEKAEELFCRIVFPETGEYPLVPGLREVCGRLLRACEGSPFEIIEIGKHLFNEAKSLSVFEKFERNLQDELQLKLSSIPRKLLSDYNELPDHLKPCFLYMVMFPEGHPVNCRMLIRLWMPEDFIREGSQNEPEDIGERYLLELMERNLVLACELEIDGRPRTCRLHSIMHKIVRPKAEDINFCTVTGGISANMRRLSMQNSGFNFSHKYLHHVHTFCSPCTGTSIPPGIIPCMKHLKILHLDHAILETLPKGTEKMLLLKYLSLSNTGISDVSTITGRLKLLETLNLKQTFVTELPDSLSDHENLRHLHVGRYRFNGRLTFDAVQGVRVPKGIGRLTNLQTLSFVRADRDHKVIKELRNLKKLRKLGIVDLPSDSGPILCETVEELKNLRSLSLISQKMNVVLGIQEINNPPHLQRLYLWGRLEKMPWWISKLQELVTIRLKWSMLEAAQNPIPILGKLNNLLELQLLNAYTGNKLHFHPGTFLKLKKLELEEMEELQMIKIDNGALLCLEKLSISLCKNLKEIPVGIANIGQLKELRLTDMPPNSLNPLKITGPLHHLVHLVKINSWYFQQGKWILQEESLIGRNGFWSCQ